MLSETINTKIEKLYSPLPLSISRSRIFIILSHKVATLSFPENEFYSEAGFTNEDKKTIKKCSKSHICARVVAHDSA